MEFFFFFTTNSLHKTLTDGLDTRGLLWCFYQLFELSFWRHPFTAEDPLLSKWCNVKFLKICSDEETKSSVSWMAWGGVHLQQIKIVKFLSLTWFLKQNPLQCVWFTSIILFFCRVSVGADMLFCMDGCTAVIDTGSSYITGPASSISILMKTIGAVELAEGGVSSV